MLMARISRAALSLMLLFGSVTTLYGGQGARIGPRPLSLPRGGMIVGRRIPRTHGHD